MGMNMDLKAILLPLAAALWMGMLGLLPTLAGAEALRPNVVLILADDLGPGDLGCYGQQKIRTPNLDRMAAEGLVLTRHYCGNAVCAPSRSVLMSGMHPGHTWVRDNRGVAEPSTKSQGGIPKVEGQHPIAASAVTLAEVMASAGYVTGGFGKWGLGGPHTEGAPLKQGFARWFGYNCQGVAHNFYPVYLWDNDQVQRLNNPIFPSNDKLRADEDPTQEASYARFSGTEYSADLIAQQAIAFVRQHRDRPFFLYWPTTVPHVALQVPEDSLKEYRGKWPDAPYTGGKGYLPHFSPRAAYAAMITRMDREIGALMKQVSDLGLEEKTLFIFLSDNGPLNGTHAGLAGTDCDFFNSNQGLRDGKGTLYEGGIRSPGILRWKGQIAPGRRSEALSGFEDWLPTLAQLAGATLPDQALDGTSLVPLLKGQQSVGRPFLYREFAGYGGQACVIEGDWKLVKKNLAARGRGKAGKAGKGAAAKAQNLKPLTELYHLKSDPLEKRDVAAENPEVVAKLEALLRREHQPSKDFPLAGLDATGTAR